MRPSEKIFSDGLLCTKAVKIEAITVYPQASYESLDLRLPTSATTYSRYRRPRFCQLKRYSRICPQS